MILRKDHFFWIDCDLEDTIKYSIIEDNFMEISNEHPNKISNKDMKRKINAMNRGDVNNFLYFIMKSHNDRRTNDFSRFFKFLQRMDQYEQ